MIILILGSEGFIGTHCVRYFLNKGNDVFGADLIEQPSQNYTYHKISQLPFQIEEVLKTNKIDVIINAAGSGNVNYSMTHPLIDFEANCLDVIKILDAIKNYQPLCKYIHISSAAVYGNPITLPVTEAASTMPLSPYGWHKLISENLCKEYYSIYNVQTTIVRPFSVYGPGLKKQLFWDLHQKVKNAKNEVELWGTGNESRDFIYIEDLVLAMDTIINKGIFNGSIYNIANGKETTIKEVVNIFVEKYAKNISVTFNGNVREGDPLNWQADITKLKELGFKPTINLEDGIVYLTNWIRNER
jgi:UDP-glucose 4-epimerase